MAASFTLTSTSYNGRRLRLYCTQTKDIANNKSTINWTLISEGGQSNYYSTGPTKVYINGTEVYSKGVVAWNSYAFPAAKGSVSGSLPVSHNNDGEKTISVSFSTAIYYSTVNTYSGNWELDSNPRQANLTGAPNFNDEENPTITYSNPVGGVVEKLEACIASEDGETIYVPYRDISKTGTSYTFSLTTAERNALRNATPNSNTLTVKFYVQTTISGVKYRSSLAKTLTIINNKPTLKPTVKDVGTASTVLTGDANKIIKGANYISVASGGAALKGATIKSQKITCGKEVINAASGSFVNVETATFTFTITDSRGNVTTQTVNKTLIPYVKLSCNMNARISIAGEIDLTLTGNYFSDTFGAVVNDLNVEYRYKELNGTYSEWTSAGIIASDNKYNGVAFIDGLDYRKTYVVQARANDKIHSITTAEKRLRAVPVFDWGGNDFQFNVDAYDKNGNKLGTEMTAINQKAVSQSGKQLLESGFVSITPVANTPTSAQVNFQRTYSKIPTVVMSVASSVAGTQVLGYGQTGISTTGVNIVVTRTNTVPTILYFFVYGEAEE